MSSPENQQNPLPKTPFLHFILPHPDKPLVLMLPDESDWTLPTIEPEESTHGHFGLLELGVKTQAVAGREVVMLRCAYFEYENDDHGHRFVFVMENQSSHTPDGVRWIGQDELKNLTLAHEHLRPILETHFHEQATGEFPRQRPPWAFPGWQGRAKNWIRDQVAAQGWQLTGEIELLRKMCITCMMKAPTSAGDLYFKAVPPTFAREIAVTRLLAERHPDIIPSVVVFHEAERWILLRDFGQQLLRHHKETAYWERAVREFAALQLDMMAHIDALFDRGALDYRLEILLEKLDALLANDAILRSEYLIPDADIERVRQAVPRIKMMIQEMGGFNIPATITHSDFHIGNIAVRDEHTIFFDWTDASVGHPFFDMSLFFEFVSRRAFADSPETVAHLKTAYLEAFDIFAPPETLQRALSLGSTLGLLHQTLNYHHLLQEIEPAERWPIDIIAIIFQELAEAV